LIATIEDTLLQWIKSFEEDRREVEALIGRSEEIRRSRGTREEGGQIRAYLELNRVQTR